MCNRERITLFEVPYLIECTACGRSRAKRFITAEAEIQGAAVGVVNTLHCSSCGLCNSLVLGPCDTCYTRQTTVVYPIERAMVDITLTEWSCAECFFWRKVMDGKFRE